MTVRLVGGSTNNEGRVEVYFNGQWMRVCGDGWDISHAEVVCRELSFGPPTQVFYGSGSGPVWLNNLNCVDNVNCVGTESTIAQCSSDRWNNRVSDFSQTDAGVICAGKLIICLILYVYIQLSEYIHCSCILR